MAKRDIDKKTTAVQIRVSIIEKTRIEQNASEKGLSLAEFIRQQVLYPPSKLIEYDRTAIEWEIRRELTAEFDKRLETGIRERIRNMSLGSLFFNRRDFRRWEKVQKALAETIDPIKDKT